MTNARSALCRAMMPFVALFFWAFTPALLGQTAGSTQVGQLAELTASDGFAFQAFGSSIAMSRSTIVVGAPTLIGGLPEAAYVFVNLGSTWLQTAKLSAGLTEGAFGYSVAIAGDTIVAGTPGAGNGQGAVYVFVKPAGGWRDMPPTAQLTVPHQNLSQKFGDSVAISSDGTTIVGGGEGDGGLGSGAAYVFVKPVRGWQDTNVPTATLSSTSATDLGNSVAVSGDGKTVAAGSLGQNQLGVGYVFTMPQGGWQSGGPVATLTNSDRGVPGDAFGYSVAVSPFGNTIVVGDPGKAAYVFIRPKTGWKSMTQTAELRVIAHEADTQLGWSVALFGNVILAGAPDIFIGQENPGAAFAYLEPLGGWANTSMPNLSVTSSDGASKDGFGEAVALSGNFGVVGAPQHAVNGNAEQGSAYIFGP
jgi:hypothetical protein